MGRVNLREMVAWSKPPGDDETQRLAEDYVRMGVTKTRWTRKPEREEREVITSLLVVGGGVTGMTTALEAAGAGHEVHLVEQEPALGGWTARFAQLFPTHPPYRDLEPVKVDRLVAAVDEDPRITVYTSTTVRTSKASPVASTSTWTSTGSATELRAGAVVMATGWKSDDGVKEKFGAGDLPDVITNVAFEEMVAAGRLVRPSDGAVPQRVAIVTRPTTPACRLGATATDPDRAPTTTSPSAPTSWTWRPSSTPSTSPRRCRRPASTWSTRTS